VLKFACPTVLSTSLVRVAVQQAGGHVLESLPGDLEIIALEFWVMFFLNNDFMFFLNTSQG